jgi:hypothetical protein
VISAVPEGEVVQEPCERWDSPVPQLIDFGGQRVGASRLGADADLGDVRLTVACRLPVRVFRAVALRAPGRGAVGSMAGRGGGPRCFRQCCRRPSSSTRVPPHAGQGLDSGRYELVQLQVG